MHTATPRGPEIQVITAVDLVDAGMLRGLHRQLTDTITDVLGHPAVAFDTPPVFAVAKRSDGEPVLHRLSAGTSARCPGLPTAARDMWQGSPRRLARLLRRGTSFPELCTQCQPLGDALSELLDTSRHDDVAIKAELALTMLDEAGWLTTTNPRVAEKWKDDTTVLRFTLPTEVADVDQSADLYWSLHDVVTTTTRSAPYTIVMPPVFVTVPAHGDSLVLHRVDAKDKKLCFGLDIDHPRAIQGSPRQLVHALDRFDPMPRLCGLCACHHPQARSDGDHASAIDTLLQDLTDQGWI